MSPSCCLFKILGQFHLFLFYSTQTRLRHPPTQNCSHNCFHLCILFAPLLQGPGNLAIAAPIFSPSSSSLPVNNPYKDMSLLLGSSNLCPFWAAEPAPSSAPKQHGQAGWGRSSKRCCPLWIFLLSCVDNEKLHLCLEGQPWAGFPDLGSFWEEDEAIKK